MLSHESCPFEQDDLIVDHYLAPKVSSLALVVLVACRSDVCAHLLEPTRLRLQELLHNVIVLDDSLPQSILARVPNGERLPNFSGCSPLKECLLL